MSQKVVQYQAVMQMAQANPQIYDQVELNKQMLEVLGVKNIGKLIPNADDQKPKDPVTENMNIINGKPVKAFIYQDHQAHIQVHMTAMQDPKILQLVGQNPQAGLIQAAAMAHINEHVAFEYRRQLEEQLGVPLPKFNETLPEDVEFELSKVMAEAAKKLATKSAVEVQQEQAQQQAQDPIIQMQQQELALKAQDLQIKQQKTMADIAIDKGKLELEKAKMEVETKLSGMEFAAKATLDKNKLDVQKAIDSVKIGLDATVKKHEIENQRNQKLQE